MADDIGKNVLGAVHTGGKVVLGAFGLGGLGDMVEEQEASRGWLPYWAMTEERKKKYGSAAREAAQRPVDPGAGTPAAPAPAPPGTSALDRARWQQLDASRDPAMWRFYVRALRDLPMSGVDADAAMRGAVGAVSVPFRERGQEPPDAEGLGTWLNRQAIDRGIYAPNQGTNIPIKSDAMAALRVALTESAQAARAAEAAQAGASRWLLFAAAGGLAWYLSRAR